MALLDTTALIDLNRRPASPSRRRAEALIAALRAGGEVLFTSRINEAEFRVGGFQSADPARETRRIEALLSILVILEGEPDHSGGGALRIRVGGTPACFFIQRQK